MSYDAGIKVSKPFYDANTAGDANLLFSSSWPSLPIAFESTQTDKTGTFNVTHGLGFVPFYSVWVIKSGVSKRFATINTSLVKINSTQITITEDPNDPGAATYNIKCYNIDISTPVTYQFVKPATTTTTYSPDYGIKISKEGKSTSSTDLRDFILHSRAQSPQILAVVTEASAVSKVITFADPQGYVAWVFGFIKQSDGYYFAAALYSQAYPKVTITPTGNNFSYSLTYAGTDIGATLMVLRDPMFTATDVVVNY